MRKIFTKAVIASVVVVMGLSGCSSNKNEEKTTASETEAVTEEVLDEATIGDAAVSNEEEASSSDASDKVADASEMTTIEDVVEEGDFERIRMLINALIEKIEIDNEDIDIHWKFA